MSATIQGVRLLGVSGGGDGRAQRTTRWLLSSVLVLVAILTALSWNPMSARRALRALPDEQRAALLTRTVDELRLSCGEGRPAVLAGHCRELASFAAQFDACSGDCEALVRRQLTPVPTR